VLHAIIEPHRDILQHMRKLGWYNRPGVKILEGRWQDFVNSPELLGLGGFDVIFTDTFSEDYQGV
jgi:protein arginine N-methyltransferase 2